MKSLSSFANVKSAIEQAIISSDVDNGTRGMEFEAVCISTHTAYQAERAEIQKDMAAAVRDKKYKEYLELEKELNKLPVPTIFTIWRLMKPITNLRGTMIIINKNQRFYLQMPEVQEVWIPDDYMKLSDVQGEDIKKKWKDAMGNEHPIIKIKLNKGLIDVYRPVRFGSKEILPKRAMCTIMSLRAQQIAGELSARERSSENRRYGFDVEQI